MTKVLLSVEATVAAVKVILPLPELLLVPLASAVPVAGAAGVSVVTAGVVAAGVVTVVAAEVESDEDILFVPQLLQAAMNRPIERLSMLIFRFFIVWCFSLVNTNKSYACKPDMCAIRSYVHSNGLIMN